MYSPLPTRNRPSLLRPVYTMVCRSASLRVAASEHGRNPVIYSTREFETSTHAVEESGVRSPILSVRLIKRTTLFCEASGKVSLMFEAIYDSAMDLREREAGEVGL